MKNLFIVIALDSKREPFDRFEVLADDIGEAHLMALTILKENLPDFMWISPENEGWYSEFKNTSKNVLTDLPLNGTFVSAQGGAVLQN